MREKIEIIEQQIALVDKLVSDPKHKNLQKAQRALQSALGELLELQRKHEEQLESMTRSMVELAKARSVSAVDSGEVPLNCHPWTQGVTRAAEGAKRAKK